MVFQPLNHEYSPTYHQAIKEALYKILSNQTSDLCTLGNKNNMNNILLAATRERVYESYFLFQCFNSISMYVMQI